MCAKEEGEGESRGCCTAVHVGAAAAARYGNKREPQLLRAYYRTYYTYKVNITIIRYSSIVVVQIARIARTARTVGY